MAENTKTLLVSDTVHLTLFQWLLATIAALAAGLSKGGFVGMGLLTVLLMAEVLPARASTGAVLPLLICADILAVLAFREHARWPTIRRLLPPALVGMIVGYVLMARIADERFRVVIGWAVLLMILLQIGRRWLGVRFSEVPKARWFAWLMGIWTGINTMVANAAGPVATLYLLALNMRKFEFVGTIAWLFLIINIAKVPFSAHLGLINFESLKFNVLLLPAVAAGVFLGRSFVQRISQSVFEAFLLATAAAASLRLIVA
jgi:uncharacterized membrane protein YfcA